MRCSWCGTDADEAAKRHEGPHATWCVHFRESQRGGPTVTEPDRPYCKPDQSCCDFCCGN